jgi:cytochrome c peroxidase
VVKKGKMPLASLVAVLFFIIQCTTRDLPRQESLAELVPSYVRDTMYLSPVNDFSMAKADLGRYLFYDRRLSLNETKACASCHASEFSFTDGYTRSIGALGDLHQRNSRPLINIVFNKYLTAADSSLHFPEDQVNNPMMNEHPVEMGIKGHEEMILQRLKEDELYKKKFSAAFPGERDPFSIRHIQWAICSFIKTIFSFQSPYDLYFYQQDKTSYFNSEKRHAIILFR